jgi:Domain of unknown function (DUF4112)
LYKGKAAVHTPSQIYRAGERLPARDPWIEHLAYLMDGAIPIGPWTIGLDPLLGLLPGVGDLIGAAISMVIVIRAIHAGIPRIAVARMMTNVAIDTFIGAIPVLGDAFDFAYKANLKNLRIYEEALVDGRSAKRRHWGFFVALIVGIILMIAGTVIGISALIRHWSLL